MTACLRTTSENEVDARGKGKGCWYFIALHSCPICGRTEEFRERRTDPRPEHWGDRHEYMETNGCGSHFL